MRARTIVLVVKCILTDDNSGRMKPIKVGIKCEAVNALGGTYVCAVKDCWILTSGWCTHERRVVCVGVELFVCESRSRDVIAVMISSSNERL